MKPKQKPVARNMQDDIIKILHIVKKNWWIALLISVFSYGIGFIYVYKQDKVFSASTQLLLKTNDQFNSSSLITENSGFYGGVYKNYVDNSNEIRVLRSQDLIEKNPQPARFQRVVFPDRSHPHHRSV